MPVKGLLQSYVFIFTKLPQKHRAIRDQFFLSLKNCFFALSKE